MKAKILLAVSLIICMISFASCGNRTTKPFAYTASDLTDAYRSIVEIVANASESDIDAYLLQGDDFTVEVFTAWNGVRDEVGSYVSIGDITVTDENDSVILKATVDFSERDCEVRIVFESVRGVIQATSAEFNAQYTFGETMLKAFQNTLMGMGIVFIVLIVISVVIALLKFVPVLLAGGAKEKKETERKPETAPVIAAQPEPESADVSDDLELAAVITAAIAAYENSASPYSVPADGFVVRSIKRRNHNNW